MLKQPYILGLNNICYYIDIIKIVQIIKGNTNKRYVEDYNIYISTFPKSILRVILRYKKADYIE